MKPLEYIKDKQQERISKDFEDVEKGINEDWVLLKHLVKINKKFIDKAELEAWKNKYKQAERLYDKLKQELRKWKETCEILSNPKTMKGIVTSLEQIKQGETIPLSKLRTDKKINLLNDICRKAIKKQKAEYDKSKDRYGFVCRLAEKLRIELKNSIPIAEVERFEDFWLENFGAIMGSEEHTIFIKEMKKLKRK